MMAEKKKEWMPPTIKERRCSAFQVSTDAFTVEEAKEKCHDLIISKVGAEVSIFLSIPICECREYKAVEVQREMPGLKRCECSAHIAWA
jgi:hypothetical protein